MNYWGKELYFSLVFINIIVVFIYAILFCCIKKYYTKFYTLFCYEIPSKREFQKFPFNHLSDIDFTEFINI